MSKCYCGNWWDIKCYLCIKDVYQFSNWLCSELWTVYQCWLVLVISAPLSQQVTVSVCLSVCLSVCVCSSVHKITHEHVDGCRPNVVGMGKGWPSRSDKNVGMDSWTSRITYTFLSIMIMWNISHTVISQFSPNLVRWLKPARRHI